MKYLECTGVWGEMMCGDRKQTKVTSFQCRRVADCRSSVGRRYSCMSDDNVKCTIDKYIS